MAKAPYLFSSLFAAWTPQLGVDPLYHFAEAVEQGYHPVTLNCVVTCRVRLRDRHSISEIADHWCAYSR